MLKLTRRQLLVGTLASAFSYGAYKLAGRSRIVNRSIPGELLGASANLGHNLRADHFQQPTQIIKKEIVIVGSGISGLAAGYRLHKAGFSDFLLLDLEKQAGGNAASGENSVSAYPWGAHYVPLLTEESTGVRKLFAELGIITGYASNGLPIYNEYYICQDPNERLYRLGRWQDGLIPTLGIHAEDQAQYRRFFGMMAELKTRKGKDGKKLFAIPVDKSSQDAEWLALDKLTMQQWLTGQHFTSEPLLWYINYCCRDDFGTTLTTTSAWAGLHYFAARSGQAANTESDSVITWPEGNGWLAKALSKPIQNQIKTQALCYSISHEADNVMVDYWDAKTQSTLRIEAKAVIIAMPRFIASRLLKSKAVSISAQDFTYSPWAVANITLDKMPAGRGTALSWDNVVYKSHLLGYVNASHQITQMNPTQTVLTYYWPLTHLDPVKAREEALNRPYQEWQQFFLKELLHIHPELENHITRMDVWLWGHGMIRPTPDFIWGESRRSALTQNPPVFTAHSDMSGISIFEEAYTRGVSTAEKVLSYLNKPYQSEL